MARIATESRTNRAAWMALGSGFVLLIGCNNAGVKVAPPAARATSISAVQPPNRSVCPQHGRVWIPARDSGASRTVDFLSIPGTITQIPEFHDCQALLKPGREGYGPTAGIYANPEIVNLVDTLVALENAVEPRRAIAAAEIISDGDYRQLGIEIGVNCLYMYTTAGQLESFMRPVINESDCLQRLNPMPPQPGWTPLHVRQEPEPSPFTRADFPPVARWDYDDLPNPKLQFIGLPCGTAWCLIGHANPHSWKRYDRPVNSSHGRLSRRVVRIRGWYDEQILGVGPASGGPGPVTPGPAFGTIFPDSMLDSRTEADFELPAPQVWVAAAEILIHGDLPRYKTKFNLERTPLTTEGVSITNKLALCKGDSARCIPSGAQPAAVRLCPVTMPDPWYARITAVGGDIAYSCVIRHVHPNFTIPGTARWWWLPTDEGIWTRCPQGCCQVT